MTLPPPPLSLPAYKDGTVFTPEVANKVLCGIASALAQLQLYELYIYIYTYIHTSLSIYLSAYIYTSNNLAIYPSIFLSVYLSIYLSMHTYIHLYLCTNICVSNDPVTAPISLQPTRKGSFSRPKLRRKSSPVLLWC